MRYKMAFVLTTLLAAAATLPASNAFAQETASLQSKASACMNNPACPLPDRIQLMKEMGNQLQADMQKMEKNCIAKHYLNCIGPEFEETRDWHRTHNNMAEMMIAMERNFSTQGEPVNTHDRDSWEDWYRADSEKR